MHWGQLAHEIYKKGPTKILPGPEQATKHSMYYIKSNVYIFVEWIYFAILKNTNIYNINKIYKIKYKKNKNNKNNKINKIIEIIYNETSFHG